jgi:PhnB protein
MTDPHSPPARPAAAAEKVVEIGAPVDVVWRALTTPEGLRNFYCDWAKVEPGVGGTFQIGWTVGGLPPATIDVWEPGARLRFTYPAPPGESVTTAEEWTLRPEGDHTVVRLVYEGFGEGSDWGEFYDRFDATAALVVDLLATYLGPAGGAPLAKASVDIPVGDDRPTAWRRTLGPGLTDDDGRPAAVAAGAPVEVALPGGEPLTGTAVHVAPGNELSVALDAPAGARLVAYTRPGPTDATTRVGVELYAWGISEGERATNQARLDAAADALGGRPPGTTAAGRSTTPEEGTVSETSYIPPGEPALTPYLCCKGAASAIDFYVEVLGAEETGSRFVDGDGKVGHAELKLHGSPFYLSDEYPDLGVVAPSGSGSSVGLTAYVPDVDAVVAKARAAGATVLQAPEETFYGTRRATIVDPYGHRWLVGTHIRDVSADEYQKAVDQFASS